MNFHQNATLRVTAPPGTDRAEALNWAMMVIANRAAMRIARDENQIAHPVNLLDWALTAGCDYFTARRLAEAAGVPLDWRKVGAPPAIRSRAIPGFHTPQPYTLPDGWRAEIVGDFPARVGQAEVAAGFAKNWPDRGIN